MWWASWCQLCGQKQVETYDWSINKEWHFVQLSSYLASCTYLAATNTQLFHLLHFRFSSFLLPLPISSSVCIRVLHVCRERNRKAKIQSMWLCTEDIFGDLHHNRSKIAELFQILERKRQDERAKVRVGYNGWSAFGVSYKYASATEEKKLGAKEGKRNERSSNSSDGNEETKGRGAHSWAW